MFVKEKPLRNVKVKQESIFRQNHRLARLSDIVCANRQVYKIAGFQKTLDLSSHQGFRLFLINYNPRKSGNACYVLVSSILGFLFFSCDRSNKYDIIRSAQLNLENYIQFGFETAAVSNSPNPYQGLKRNDLIIVTWSSVLSFQIHQILIRD